MQIIYLPMPVDVDKKRELNKAGYRVVDIAFMPDGYENHVADCESQCDQHGSTNIDSWCQNDTGMVYSHYIPVVEQKQEDKPKRRGRKPKDQSE